MQERQALFYLSLRIAHHSRKVMCAEAKMTAVSQEEERRLVVWFFSLYSVQDFSSWSLPFPLVLVSFLLL